MLRFKQFIKQYLFEAKAEHFAHIGLNVNNAEHKDMLDAFNSYGHKLAKKNPNQYKSIDELSSAVRPHIENIKKRKRESEEDKQAFINKDAELVHHDKETGVKVFKVRNSRGCVAAGGGATGCVYDRESGQLAMDSYDPTGEHSHIIHTPEKGNLSRISIIGVKPREPFHSGVAGNFQDKGNVSVSDSDWEMLRKKYKLDSVKALHGIRGLHNSEVDKEEKEEAARLVQPHMTDHELANLASHHNNPHVHRAIMNHKNVGGGVLSRIAYKSDDPEVHKAIVKHEKVGDYALSTIADKSNDPEVHKAIMKHEKVGDETLSRIASKTYDPEVHKAIMKHEKVGDETLSRIADKSNDPEVHKAIMNHKNAGDITLSQIADKSNDPEVHKAIMNHKNAGDYALSTIANKTIDPEVHKAIMNHKNAGDITLSRIASKTYDPELHKAIMNHKKVGDNTLSTIADKSNDPELHKAIVNHGNAGYFTLHNIASKYGFGTGENKYGEFDPHTHMDLLNNNINRAIERIRK